MAESAVLFLLDKLANLVETKVQLVKGVWEEIAYLRGELERTSAFLKDADKVEETSDNQELKVWVKQVREVAHEQKMSLMNLYLSMLIIIMWEEEFFPVVCISYHAV